MLLETCIKKRLNHVFFNGVEKSDFFFSMKGVRQGENLSTLLFSIFVNDTEDFLLQHNCVNIDLNDETLNMYLKHFLQM